MPPPNMHVTTDNKETFPCHVVNRTPSRSYKTHQSHFHFDIFVGPRHPWRRPGPPHARATRTPPPPGPAARWQRTRPPRGPPQRQSPAAPPHIRAPIFLTHFTSGVDSPRSFTYTVIIYVGKHVCKAVRVTLMKSGSHSGERESFSGSLLLVYAITGKGGCSL